MNSTDQEYFDWRQRRDMDSIQQWTGLGETAGNALRTPNGAGRTNRDWEQRSPSSQRRYGVDSAAFTQDINMDPDGEPVTDPDGEPVTDPDGEPVTDPDGEPVTDPDAHQELARKRKELQLIEERILLKKGSIAMKKIVPLLHADAIYKVFNLQREEGLSHSEAPVAPQSNEPSIRFFGEREAELSYDKRPASNHDLPVRKGEPLKDRVNGILQQRRPAGFAVGFLRKVHSQPSDHMSLVQPPKVAKRERMNKYISSKDVPSLGDHPLKCRVKALMTQRRSYACVSQSDGKVPGVEPPPPSQTLSPTALKRNAVARGLERLLNVLDKGVDINLIPCVEPPPPSQRPAPTALKQDTVSRGLERFLNVLNKGVDINLLTKIVNEDSVVPPVVGELPPLGLLENGPDLALCRKESQESHGRVPQGHSRSCSLERRTGSPDPNGSHTQIPGVSEANEKSLRSDGRGVGRLVSGGRPVASPDGVVEEEKEKEKEVKPENLQLQNLVKTLGLSLEPEELSKLTDRTQERLYGKKTEERKEAENAREKEKEERLRERLLRLHRGSSSSSSSSSSSGSSSASPPPRRRSSSSGKASGPSRERGATVESSRGDRERAKPDREQANHVGDRERAERRRDIDEERAGGRKGYLGHHPYPENTTNPFPRPAAGFAAGSAAGFAAGFAAGSAVTGYSAPEVSQYSAYHSSTYNGASPWAYDSASVAPLASYPPGSSPYIPLYSPHHLPGSVNVSNPIFQTNYNYALDNPLYLRNPDLSTSEGQGNPTSASYCLQVRTLARPKGSKKKAYLKWLTNYAW